MIRKGEWHLVRAMKNEGASISEISRRYGIDRKTVRKLLEREFWPDDTAKPRVARDSKLDPFRPYIKARLEKVQLSSVRLFEEIKGQGYTGRMTILRDFVRSINEHKRMLAVVRFETLPGEQSQVDWVHVGRFCLGGMERNVYAFVMVLGSSRARFVTFTHSMDIHSLMRCHIEAFRYFGGHTRQILYDNMKTVILRPKSIDSPAVVNPQFLDFAGYYGFGVDSCHPYRPQTKGKVERLGRYVQESFIAGREFASLDDMKHQGLIWCDQVNGKAHGTTGKVPAEELANEKLLSLPLREYDTSRRSIRTVSRDCFISYEGVRYEVPWRYAAKSVVVNDDDDGRLLIYGRDGEPVMEHRKAACAQGVDTKKGIVRVPHLNDELWERVLGRDRQQRHREPSSGAANASAKLVLVGGEVPALPVQERDLAYYEEVAG